MMVVAIFLYHMTFVHLFVKSIFSMKNALKINAKKLFWCTQTQQNLQIFCKKKIKDDSVDSMDTK